MRTRNVLWYLDHFYTSAAHRLWCDMMMMIDVTILGGLSKLWGELELVWCVQASPSTWCKQHWNNQTDGRTPSHSGAFNSISTVLPALQSLNSISTVLVHSMPAGRSSMS